MCDHPDNDEGGASETHLTDSHQESQIWYPNWVRLAPNGTNMGLLKISFITIWLAEPKCKETYLKKSHSYFAFCAQISLSCDY